VLVKNRWLLNLALALLIAGLAVLVVYKPGQHSAPTSPLTDLTAETVRHVRIARPGRAEIQLIKCHDAWRLTAPLSARANRFNVENLLRLASVPVEGKLDVSASDTTPYGLDPPLARVRLNDEEIAFGALHPFKNQQYVRYREAIYLIPAHLYGPAAHAYTQYLDTRLLEPRGLLSVIKLPNFSLALTNGTWARTPADESLSGDRINDYVAAWQHASALSVERYSGKPALLRIHLTFSQDDQPGKLSLAVLSHQPEFVLYRPDEGLEYHFPEEIGRRLLQLTSESK
jgi:hypothetical protein